MLQVSVHVLFLSDCYLLKSHHVHQTRRTFTGVTFGVGSARPVIRTICLTRVFEFCLQVAHVAANHERFWLQKGQKCIYLFLVSVDSHVKERPVG